MKIDPSAVHSGVCVSYFSTLYGCLLFYSFPRDATGYKLMIICLTYLAVVNKNCLLYEGAYQFLTFIVLVRDCWKKKKWNFLNKELLIISFY